MTNLARRFPVMEDERVALITDDGGQVSYGALGEMVGAVRGGLVAAGLGVGDHVLLIGDNTDLSVVFHLACVTAGLVSMPLDPLTTPKEIARIVDDHHPAAVIADAVGASSWADSTPNLAGIKLVSTSAADRLALLDHEWVPGTDVADDHPAVLSIGALRLAQTHGQVAVTIDAMTPSLTESTGGEPVVLGIGPLHDPSGLDVLHTGLANGATILVDNVPAAELAVDGLRRSHTDRPDGTRDMIVISGLEVSASEVERLLVSHVMVDAVSVVGEPDATTGERLVAYVAATKPPTVDERPNLERELIEFCAERLEPHKVPRRIVFTSSIPSGFAEPATGGS